MTREAWRGSEREREESTKLTSGSETSGWASMHGYTCVCTRCQLRTERERRRCDTGGRRRVGGECQDSGGEGLNSLYYTP